MKNIIIILAGCILFFAASCIKADNYPAPNGTVNGTITDSATGQPFQSGPNDERLYVLQTNYKKGTAIPFYWDVQPSGIFNNSKVFADTYQIYPTDGAFVPLVYTSNGNLVDNGSKMIDVKPSATTTVNFTVVPFLKVEWMGDPVINSDGTVSVQCKFTRGTTDPHWIFNVTDVFFFISNTQYVSSGSYDNTLSTDMTFSGAAGNNLLGTTITLTSKDTLESDRKYYIRIGARTADNVNKRYNYTEVKELDVP